MALFKVVLGTWGKIVGEAVWVAISRATSGCKNASFGKWITKIMMWVGQLEIHFKHQSRMIFVDSWLRRIDTKICDTRRAEEKTAVRANSRG